MIIPMTDSKANKMVLQAYEKKLEKIKEEIEIAQKNLESKVSKYDAVRKKRNEAIADHRQRNLRVVSAYLRNER